MEMVTFKDLDYQNKLLAISGFNPKILVSAVALNNPFMSNPNGYHQNISLLLFTAFGFLTTFARVIFPQS